MGGVLARRVDVMLVGAVGEGGGGGGDETRRSVPLPGTDERNKSLITVKR